MDLTPLIAELQHDDPAVRAAAAEELCHLGDEARAAAAALAGAAGDEAEEVREWAVAALEEIGPPEADQLSDVAALLSGDNADTAYWAATLLGRLAADAAAAVGPLAEALTPDRPLVVRQRAAWALERIGPTAAAAAPALRQAATEYDPRLAQLAAKALAKLDSHPSEPTR